MDQIISAADARLESDAFNAQVCSDLFRAIRELANKEGKYSIQLEKQNYSLGEYLSHKYFYRFNRETGVLSW
jgi:hypothetical protein